MKKNNLDQLTENTLDVTEEFDIDSSVTIFIVENNADIRIDKYLSEVLADKTRSFIQGLIKSGLVKVNNNTVKSNYCVKINDCIEVDMPEPVVTEILPQDIPLDILYEDDDVMVVNKPKNMVVHPAPGHYSDTLVNAIMFHCKDSLSGINGEIRPGIVHRIDKDTTGSLIICKNDFAHNNIAEQIKSHSLKRVYCGIVSGNIKEDEGTINAPIGRNKNDRKKMAIDNVNGRQAVTHYKVLARLKDGNTYMQFRLETGRTHQIRVHMASIGHPLIGDEIYSNNKTKYKLQGQTLHAAILGFIHPRTGKEVICKAPIPDYFINILKNNGLDPIIYPDV